MSKVLFVNGNLHGHINPTLPIVKELVQCGEEIYYFSTMEFQQKIEATGAIFLDYGSEFDHFLHSFRPHGNHPFYRIIEFMLAMDRTVVPIVLKKTKEIKFDYLLHDVMFGGGNILAKELNIPAISSCSSFVMEKPPIPARMLEPGFHPQLDYLYEELAAARSEWEIDMLTISDVFFKKESLNLVYTSKLFQPEGDRYDDSYRFVGPSLMDRVETLDFILDTSGEKKIIYISLGTINNNCMDFYHKCIEAFSEECYQVIMSVGSKIEISSLQPLPNNFVVRNYIPQLEVLKHADVIISHGGLNSVSEALYYGVPVITIPMANDQPAVARRLTELGAGMELKMEEITTDLLLNTVKTILLQKSFQENSDEIAASFVEAGGYKKAVKEILAFT
jgi:MGT family glycosyltransferase